MSEDEPICAEVTQEEYFEQWHNECEALRTELAAARAENEALRGERDAAVKEAARRDQKWMDGIDTICGIKLNYQSPFVDGGVSLDQFINALAGRAYSAEAELDALALALGECVEALREIADPIAYMRKRAEEQGLSLNGMMTVRIAEDHNYLKAIAIKALASPLAARSSERMAKMREVVEAAREIVLEVHMPSVELQWAIRGLDNEEHKTKKANE